MKINYPDNLTIRQYIEGKLDSQLMHEMEKQAMDDPFLYDALEGYDNTAEEGHGLSILQRQLHERIVHLQENKKVFDLTWQRLSVAAAAAVMFISTGVLFWMNTQKYDAKLAVNTRQVEVALTPADTLKTTANNHVIKNPEPEKPASVIAEPENKFKDNSENRGNSYKNQPLNSLKEINKEIENPVLNGALRPEPMAPEGKPMAANKLGEEQISPVASTDRLSKLDDIIDKSAFGKDFKNSEKKKTAIERVSPEVIATGQGMTKKPADADSKDNAKLDGLSLDQAAWSSKTVMDDGLRAKTESESSTRPASGFRKSGSLAQPVNGWESYQQYLDKNAHLLKAEPLVSAEVKVSFWVNSKGNPHDFKIIKGLTKAYNSEAIRLIKDGPKWKPDSPGIANEITIAITFK